MQLSISVISTGGTIEKTYDPLRGVLENKVSNLDYILSQLRLEGVTIHRNNLMNKDSLDMTEADHQYIAKAVALATEVHDGVVVVHGTDRLTKTGEMIVATIDTPRKPIVLTGAMRPFELRTTDAVQNLTEALLAVQLLKPGVYLAMHNRVLAFPGVIKDRRKVTFVHKDEWQQQRENSASSDES